MIDATAFLPGLSPVAGKSLTAALDAGNLTSDGGLVALREIEQRLGLAEVIARPVPDARNPLLVTHTYVDMVRARMMMIAAGHEDCDDIDRLKSDPAFKIACNRAPESGIDLMSQPTLSRLENAADARALYKIGSGMIGLFCRGSRTPPHGIVLDIDDTDDLVHGSQQLALFNTHAGGHCFQPIHIFEGVFRQADPVAVETRQAPIGRGDRACVAQRDPVHPVALAERAHPDAWRQPLYRPAYELTQLMIQP